MAVNLSPVFGVAGQLFDNNGNPLAGGKIFTYAAGTTTPVATFTSASGSIAHSNPIVLDGAGRVPSGEIWLTDGITYKFVVEDSTSALIGTFDNLSGINSNFVAFTNQQEIQTATAGQTVFNLTTVTYQPSTNSLSVFVDGVNQYGPGAQYAYVETDQDTVTFVSGLHVGASVKFTTSQLNSSGAGDASQISYTAPYPLSVTTNVEVKLAQIVSVKDFGAIGDGVADDTAAIQDALDAHNVIYVPNGTYLCGALTFNSQNVLKGESRSGAVLTYTGSTTFITGGVDLSRVGFENLTINESSNPNGYAIFFDSSTTRQPRIVNIAVTGFANGIRIDDALNGWMEQVYIEGQGAGVAGSVGLQFGESPMQSGTTWQTNNVYINSFETAVKTWATASMFNTLIIENCTTGFYSSAPCTVIAPWFDTVTTEFDLYLNGICIIAPRWANNDPQVNVDFTTTYARTTIIPVSGDTSPIFDPSWKFGYLNIWRTGELQQDILQNQPTPTFNFSINPSANYSNGIERKTTAGTGYSYDLQAGGAKSGETNTDGGDLALSSGVSTGSGGSDIYIQTVTPGASGTTDRTPNRKWIFGRSGVFSPWADDAYNIGQIGASVSRVKRVHTSEGYVVTTPDGTNNYLIAVDNSGNITTTLV
jgi:hypothetical protein